MIRCQKMHFLFTTNKSDFKIGLLIALMVGFGATAVARDSVVNQMPWF